MISLFSMLFVAVVPTPSEALLDSLSPAELTRSLLAQADTRAAEEEALERDMERSRARLGHGRKDVQPAPETAPAPMPAPAVEQPTTDGTPPAGDAPAPPRRVKERRIRERRAAHIEVLYEGHGKGHYLGWGIADWVIAGGMWAGALTAALEAVFFAALANAFDNNHPGDRPGLWIAGGFAAVSIGLGLGGTFVAINAADNISIWREMRDEERSRRGR